MDKYRALFPVTSDYVYLNHAANSPEPMPVLEAIQDYLSACSSCGTAMETQWKHKPGEARKNITRMLDCSPGNIAFLPNVSAAVNLVAGGLDWKPGDNVVVTRDQFPANVYPWMFLHNSGVEVRIADWQTHGFTEAIRKVVDKRTRVVAVSWVEYYSGHRHNLADVGILCEKMNIIFVVDAIQGVGVLPFKQGSTGADLVAAGGHKWLLGPEGQGAAYFSHRLLDRLNPKVNSWRSIEDFMNFDSYHLDLKSGANRFEAGTPNWPGIIGLGAGVELLLDVGADNVAGKIRVLTTRLLDELRKLPGEILTPTTWSQRAGIVSFCPQGLGVDYLRDQLLERKIVCSARREALRVSPHFYNTLEEIDYFCAVLKELVK